MKSLAKGILMLAVGMIVSLPAQAGKKDVEKKKVIEKSFSVSPSTIFSVKNMFGKVHVETGAGSKIDVKVEVIARKRNDEKAQETLDKIQIKIGESSGEIEFATDIEGQMNNNNKDNFEINYLVKMPSKNPLVLHNSFGDAFISDREGSNDIKLSYCDFRIEKLSGKSEMKISFSDGSIESVKTGELIAKYSDFTVDQMGIVKLEQSFSDVSIGSAETIQLISKYGDLSIDRVVGVKGKISFSGFDVERLEQEAILETSYAGLSIDIISKDFGTIDIQGKFGGMKFGFEAGLDATFQVNTKFCDFDESVDRLDLNYKVSEDFKGEYRGKIGNGNGGNINIVSSYGDVTFR